MSCGDASDGCDKDEELGNGATTGDQDGPQPVITGGGLTDTNRNVAAITAGYAHTCAVTTAGKAYCWGSDHQTPGCPCRPHLSCAAYGGLERI
jgi:alpha-tubulin suppressor-like RCC1 family protein